MKDFDYYLNRATNEELLEGRAISISGASMIRRVESLKEYEEVLTRCEEPRGIICNGNYYLQNIKSDIMHSDIIEFLIKKELLQLSKEDLLFARYANHNMVTHKYLCVHTHKDGRVYLSESYPFDIISDPEINIHFKILDKLNIPYKKEKI